MVSVGNGVPRSYFPATISDCGLSLSALCAGLLRFGNATLSNSFPQKVKATYLDIPSESRIYMDIFLKCTDSIRGAARGSAGRTRSRWPPSPGGRARRYPGSGAPGSRTGGRGRTWHRLGHTCATLLLSRNVNPKIVSEMLGHANITITLDNVLASDALHAGEGREGIGGSTEIAYGIPRCSTVAVRSPRLASEGSFFPAIYRYFWSGRCWVRTSDLCRV